MISENFGSEMVELRGLPLGNDNNTLGCQTLSIERTETQGSLPGLANLAGGAA